MNMLVELRLRELLEENNMTRSELADKTGLSLERVGKLVNNQWSQVTRKEVSLLLEALSATIEQLFSVHQASLFFGARHSGPLTIHVSARPHSASGGTVDPSIAADTASYNHRDMEALKIIYDYARGLGIDTTFEFHGPDPMGPEDYRALTAEGSHVVIGSNVTGQFSEYAITEMGNAPAFDADYHDRFPFNFAWGPQQFVKSSFGFDGVARNLKQGIYATKEKELVAIRKPCETGIGSDCGLIAVTRIEASNDQDKTGLRNERCVIVLAGHGRHGTLGCAQVLIDPKYQQELYPVESGKLRMYAVQSKYLRTWNPANPDAPNPSEMTSAEIVAAGWGWCEPE